MKNSQTTKKTPVKKGKTAPAKRLSQTQSVTKASRYQPDEAFTDAFIQEVTEDVKNDNLKVLWNRYGLFIILFVVAAVSAAVGFETIKNWHYSKYQTRTQEYMAAVQTPDLQEAKSSLEKIADTNAGIYSELARIQIANILFEQNQNNEAVSTLESIINDSKIDKRIQNLAALKLAAYKVDFASKAEIQNLLQPIVKQNNAWTPLAKDLLAMSAIHNGDIEEARLIYAELLQADNLPENFRIRIQDMMSALNDM